MMVYCGQTVAVAWIKMKLDTEVGLAASAPATLCEMGTQLPKGAQPPYEVEGLVFPLTYTVT